MPFDFDEYDSRCSTLSPEALQKEWENYTRHIAGGATSTAGSVLCAPMTGGVSLVGLGFSTPRIHNARKKRAIIEVHLQAHGTTHHTRKRDVVGPMVIAGTLGGLTMGFAGAGAELIAGEAAEKGLEEVVSHAVLEMAGATLEHKHDERKRAKDQLDLATKYPNADGSVNNHTKNGFLSLPTGSSSSVRKSKSDTHLDGLAYGSLPGDRKPTSPSRPRVQPSQSDRKFFNAYGNPISVVSKPDDGSRSQSIAVLQASTVLLVHKNNVTSGNTLGNGIKVPDLGLSDYNEARNRDLHWDPVQGMYVTLECLSIQDGKSFSSPNEILNPGFHPRNNFSDQSEVLSNRILVQKSDSTTIHRASLLIPGLDNESPSLPPRPQSVSLPPRPRSCNGVSNEPSKFQPVEHHPPSPRHLMSSPVRRPNLQ